MRLFVIFFLIVSLFMISACATQGPSDDLGLNAEFTEDDALEEIDSSFIQENDDIEIGEMI